MPAAPGPRVEVKAVCGQAESNLCRLWLAPQFLMNMVSLTFIHTVPSLWPLILLNRIENV